MLFTLESHFAETLTISYRILLNIDQKEKFPSTNFRLHFALRTNKIEKFQSEFIWTYESCVLGRKELKMKGKTQIFLQTAMPDLIKICLVR